MANDSISSEQEKNDDLQILSTLLIKKRPPEKSEIVKGILASDNDLQEKIRLISAVDDEIKRSIEEQLKQSQHPEKSVPQKIVSEKSAPEKPVSNKSEKDPPPPAYLSRLPKKPVKKTQDSDYVVDSIASEAAAEVRSHRRHISQDRKTLKPLIRRASFFSFLFTERRKIKIFSSESGIIKINSFSTKLLLNPMILKIFPENIHNVAKELLKSLKIILDNGWFYMEKRDYNLIVLLNKLCREVSQVNFNKFDPKSPDLIDRIPAVELLFLILNYEPGDIRELLYAVDTVFNTDPSKRDLQKETSVNIHKLLDKDLMRPSLYNLIIGLNIIKTKTYLELENLQKPSLQLIDIHDYNCSPKTRDKIDEFLRKLEKGIQPYLEHEKEVYRLHAFIPTNGKGVVDYSLLQHFYDTVHDSRKISFNANKDNIIKFIINLGAAFLISFREILSELVELERGQKARLFAQTIFGQDILRIEFNLGKLDKIQTILPNFPTSRALFIKKSISGAIESEADAVRVIYEITSTMAAIGKRIAHILQRALPQSYDKTETKEILFFSFDDVTYTIPYENQKIIPEGFLKGYSVKEALFQIAGVCYQTGAFVKHGELSDLLAKEKQIHDEIRIKIKQYKRIAHEKVYEAFVGKYDLPL